VWPPGQKRAEILLRAPGAGARAAEKTQPGAGEEGAGKMVLRAGAAEAGHGGVQFRSRGPQSALIFYRECGRGGGRSMRRLTSAATLQDRRVERGAAQREVDRGGVEKRGAACSFGPFERLRRALEDGAADFVWSPGFSRWSVRIGKGVGTCRSALNLPTPRRLKAGLQTNLPRGALGAARSRSQ